MKILIIPDVHGRKFWRKAEECVNDFDKIIFLGDYLDPYGYEYEKNPDSMEESVINTLKDIIQFKKNYSDKVVLLTGNHVDHYIWEDMPRSSRFNLGIYKEVHSILLENLDLFQMVFVYKGIIFSHAGILGRWAQRFLEYHLEYDDVVLANYTSDDYILEAAIVLQDTPLKDFPKPYINAISEISEMRGGDNFYGSCEWADVSEHFTRKLSGFSPYTYEHFQVFGHTQLAKNPLIQETFACLDCRKLFEMDTTTKEIKEYV